MPDIDLSYRVLEHLLNLIADEVLESNGVFGHIGNSRTGAKYFADYAKAQGVEGTNVYFFRITKFS